MNFSVYTDFKNGNREHLLQDGFAVAGHERVVHELLAFKRRRRGVITNSDYYLEQIPRYLSGEMREPCRSGIRTIHIDPTGQVKRCPDFPTDFHWRDSALRAHRLQSVLLRVPRRGPGAAPPVARPGRHRHDVARGHRACNAGNRTQVLTFVNAAQVVTCAGPARARRAWRCAMPRSFPRGRGRGRRSHRRRRDRR